MTKIKAVTIITAQGVNSYRVGYKSNNIDGFLVKRISFAYEYIEDQLKGYRYDIFDEDNNLRVSISYSAPHEVEYDYTESIPKISLDYLEIFEGD